MLNVEPHLKPAPHKPGYRVHEWEDETSMFDPRGRWEYGSECFYATYRCYVPARLKDENFDAWLDRNADGVVYINEDGTPMKTAMEEFLEQNANLLAPETLRTAERETR